MGDWPLAAWLAVGAVVLGLILAWLIWWQRPRRPYARHDSLFTASELFFLAALEAVVDGRARVYAKVRLADLVKVSDEVPRKFFLRAFNPIACKHVDYVIAEPETCAIICAVELDDRSHERPDRQARDAFVDSVMLSAGIPILHVPTQDAYDPEALLAMLDDLLPAKLDEAVA